MLRALIIAAMLLAAPGCAHAQPEAARVERAAARVMVAALAEEQYRQHGYRWDALSLRVSRYMHWHLAEPDPLDRPPDAITRRNGWIDGEGDDVGVTAVGIDGRVTALTFDFDGFTTLALLEALRLEGAEVSFQADYESYSEYVVSAPGRGPALLTAARVCRPPQGRAASHCHNELTLAFESP